MVVMAVVMVVRIKIINSQFFNVTVEEVEEWKANNYEDCMTKDDCNCGMYEKGEPECD